MDNQQRTAFDQWFDSELDPELNLTPGDKELCRHAWQAALSHAEGEAVPVGYLSVLSDGTRIVDTRQQYDAPEVWPLYTHPAPQVAVPEEREWNQAAGRDDLKYTEGWNACRDAMLAAAPTSPAPTKGEEVHVNVDGGSVYTLPLEPTGMAAPRFVVHVPAPDGREIAARALDEFRAGPLRSACLSYGWDTESDAYIVDRMLDEDASLLRAGKEGEQS